jgi:hypothetical protein
MRRCPTEFDPPPNNNIFFLFYLFATCRCLWSFSVRAACLYTFPRLPPPPPDNGGGVCGTSAHIKKKKNSTSHVGLLYRKWVEYFLISFGKFKVLDKIGCAAAGREGWRTFPFFFFPWLGCYWRQPFFIFFFACSARWWRNTRLLCWNYTWVSNNPQLKKIKKGTVFTIIYRRWL